MFDCVSRLDFQNEVRMEDIEVLKEENKSLSEQVEELEGALRAIAFHVGVGGYNSDKVNPEVYEDKIIKGIDNLCSLSMTMGRRMERVLQKGD